jgi:PAS domain S-box-containing protein
VLDFTKNGKDAGDLSDVLKQLVKVSESGDFNVVLNPDHLNSEDALAVSLINKTISNYKSITEYNWTKFELARKARNVMLWDMNVVTGDPLSPDNVIEWFPDFPGMLGYSDESDFPGVTEFLRGRTHPDDAEKALIAFNRHLNGRTGKTPYEIECRIRDKNGEYRYFQVYGATQRDEEGLPLRTAGALKDITTQKQAQIHEDEDRVKLTLDSVPLAASLWDRDLNLIYCSAVARESLGYPDQRDLNAMVRNIMPEYQPDGRLSKEVMAEAFRIAFEQGRHLYEAWYSVVKGELVSFDVRLVRIKYGDDFAVVAYAQYRVDLTEHKKIQEAPEKEHKTVSFLREMGATLLEADETLGSAIIKSMDLAGQYFDADYIQIWRNETIDGVLHFTLEYGWRSDFKQKPEPVPVGQLTFPYSAIPGWEERFTRGECINGPLSDFSPHEYDFMNLFDIKTLVVIPLFLNGRLWGLFNADDCRRERVFSDEEMNNMRAAGRLVMSAAIHNAMLTSIQAERDMNQALSRWYGSILDAVPHIIAVTDPDKKYIFVNAAGLKHAGMEREDLLGKPCNITKSPICDTEDCSIVRAQQGIKQTYFRRDGLSFQVDTELLKDIDGKTIAFVEIIQDITKIEEMTEKQALAEAASEAKTKFLANMSHEIRTPMNSIIGFTELALGNAVSPKTIEYLKMVIKNSELLMQIINDVLDVAKIEAGSMNLEIIPFDLWAVYESCVSVMTPRAKEKNIHLDLHAEAPEGKRVLGDPTRLTQVLINLLSNAVKFTDTGNASLSASLENQIEQHATLYGYTYAGNGRG